MTSFRQQLRLPSWAILVILCLLLLAGWLWDRHRLESALNQQDSQNRRLAATIERLKMDIVTRFLSPTIRDRSVQRATCNRVADTIFRKQPLTVNAAEIWRHVTSTYPDSKLTDYHFHIDNWDEDPDHSSPRDIHLIVDTGGNVVGFGIEQGLTVGSDTRRAYASVYFDGEWHSTWL